MGRGKKEEQNAQEPEPMTTRSLIAKAETIEPPGPLIPQSENEYVKVPHFKFMGTPEMVKDRLECKKKCDGQDECRSYSWKETSRSCFWSTGSIRYGSFWNFYSKEYEYNAFGQFEPTKEFIRFKGMYAIDVDEDMTTKENKSVEDCKQICNEDQKCQSFSYHESAHACLMGISRVSFAQGWDYYERNRKPKEIGGPYRLFPQRLDSYHRELRKREKTSLGIFAESDAKIRIKNQKKLKHVEIANKDTIARKKRLDEEMKQKEFANEQKRKKEGVTKIQEKTDLEEAKSRGKFDEAFHKQSAINDELLQKKGTENAVKSSTIQRIHEKDRKNQRKLEIKIANLKDASAKRLAAKVKETESKSTLAKSEKLANAVSMKKEAFALVNSERSIKSGMGYDAKKKDDLHSMKTLKRNTYLAQDDYEQANMKEKDVKFAIHGEKAMHEVKRKLIIEKQEKMKQAAKVRAEENARAAADAAAAPVPGKAAP